MKRKPSKAKKPKSKKPSEPDASQIALTNVEKIIGGKLADGMKLKR
jgi:hypothetical protein